MYRLLIFLDNTVKDDTSKFVNFLINIFAPFFYLLEYIAYYYFWKKIVIFELLTNDVIVDFLDKNEFGLINNKSKISKCDLIESNQYFDRLSLEDSKIIIKKEFVETISELINKNISINIEDYITLIVETEKKVIFEKNQRFAEKVYSVDIQFYRYYFLKILQKKTIYWFIYLGIVLLIGYFLINSININKLIKI
jgi:hypothetical protein